MGIAADLGYSFRRPNPLQRAMQAFAGTRPGAWFFSKALRHLDTAVARLTGGRIAEVIERSREVYGGYAKYQTRITGRRLRAFILEPA